MAYSNKNGIYEVMSLPESNLDIPYSTTTQQTSDNQNVLSQPQQSAAGFETMDRQSVAGTNTLKRNPKMELSKTDLLRLLSYMEGELQAQNIVIAALKSERLKHEVQLGRYKPSALNSPLAALARDSMLEKGGQSVHSHQEMSQLADQQLEALDNLVLQQRRMQIRMANILKEAEEKHHRVIQELEEEKRKHEHDTAQGDDITYGLEMERTRLKQELEMEKQAKKRNEKDQKKFQESVEDERSRQKQIVLLLLAERKKIIIRYIEERKRSEDLAQILSEEKARIDAMAEGLEEESKKSLRSEAELEKHLQLCEKEKAALRLKISSDEQKIKELESELQVYKQMVCGSKSGVDPVISQSALPNRVADVSAMIPLETGIPSSVAKVMQPTSTVSSVPVSGPTTGIAQTIHATIRPGASASAAAGAVAATPASTAKTTAVTGGVYASARASATSPVVQPISSGASIAGGPSSATPTQGHPYLKKGAVINRGVPPPIPPNKPVVPPKTGDRKSSLTNSTSQSIAPVGVRTSPSVTGSNVAGGTTVQRINPNPTGTDPPS